MDICLSSSNQQQHNIIYTHEHSKNEIKKYDDGQRMVRAITADSEEVPTDQALRELTIYCRNDMGSTPTYDVLWQRLTDYKRLRHVEKALMVIEHLILNGTKKFVRICTARRAELEKLQKYVYKVDGSDIGQNVRRRAKVVSELLQRDEIQNKTNNFDDSNYGSGMDKFGFSQKETGISSYDDYFDAADREDNLKKMANSKKKDQDDDDDDNKKSEKKKKKKKKKKAKKNEFEKQKSVFSSGDDMDDDIESDPFPSSSSKSTKKKKKKKKKKATEFDENSGFGDDNDPFFDANDVKKGTVASSEDLFSSSNDDSFWKSNTVQPEQSPPNKVDKVKSVSAEPPVQQNGGDDLMDFFSSSSTTNNNVDPFANDKTMNAASMNERNRLQQKDFAHQQQMQQPQQQQSSDPFNSFGNGNNDPFFSSNSNQMQNNNNNMGHFGTNVFNQSQPVSNNAMNGFNAFGANNNNNAMNGYANNNNNGNPFGNNNGFGNVQSQPQMMQTNNNNAFGSFGNNTFNNNSYMAQNNNAFGQSMNMNNGFGTNNNGFGGANNGFSAATTANANTQSDPFGDLMGF